MSLFGNSLNAPQQQSSPFALNSGSGTANKPNLFGNIGSQPSQPQQGGSSSIFGGTASSQPKSNLFGGAFGSSAQQGGSGLALNQPQQNTISFGGSTQQPQQQQSPFGSSILGQQQQPQQGGGLGSGFNQSQQPTQSGSILGQSQQQQGLGKSSLWQPGSGMTPRQKSVAEQVSTLEQKWKPFSSDCVFQHYFYNHVGESRAPYYRPSEGEDERKWEEALARKPGPGYIPVRAVGFENMGARLLLQHNYIRAFNVRLHEINNCLTALLQKHDLVTSIRAMDAKRRHQQLSARCLRLATKVQVLRNRGYAMAGSEEDLKQKLLNLLKDVSDPASEGRSEEIWARMVGIRERGRALQDEMEKLGRNADNNHPEVMDEELMKKAAKVLEDYGNQLGHLRKEFDQIQADYQGWEESNRTFPNGSARDR
ncbi:MAG: hypothetical protein M1837_004273 [Sclerophora amabilis]|nr:MAG: hypothetical protein M1837_004273 [Sclerophora amabilis]